MLTTTTNVVAYTLADQTWYILIKDIITLIITVSGLVIGGGGIATWKKQKMGEKESAAFQKIIEQAKKGDWQAAQDDISDDQSSARAGRHAPANLTMWHAD